MGTESGRRSERFSRRVAWFGLLYVASLGAFTAAVYALRSLIPH